MESSNQKIEIMQDFDSLINQVEIDIKKSLEKFIGDQFLGQIKCFQVKNRDSKVNLCFKLAYFDSFKPSQENQDQWSTKVVDYLTQIRFRTIGELKNAQNESLENETSFANKFYFQIRIQNPDNVSLVFNLYTFVTDFYMSPSDINL